MTIAVTEIGDEAPTALYRLYDAGGKLLYIGISGSLKKRLAMHADSKPWWPEVTRKTVEWHTTRASAAKTELKAIRSERPAHNMRGFKSGPEIRINVTGAEIYELVQMEMPPTSLRLALLELIGIPTREALDMLGVGRTHGYRVIEGRKRLPRKNRQAY